MIAVAGLGVVVPPVAGAGPDWFAAEPALAGRGYRRLPRATQYLLGAAARAVLDAGDLWAATPTEARGAVVATNNAGAALVEAMDTTILRDGARELSPSLSPYSTMSSFAGRLSVEQGIHGFCLLANSPATAGLEALALAARAVATGRARTVLVAAVEETLSPTQSEHPSQTGAVVLVGTAPGPTGAAGLSGPDGPAPADGPARAGGLAGYGTCRARAAFLAPGSDAGAVLTRLVGERPPERIVAVLEDSAAGAAVAGRLDRLPGVEIVPTPAHSGCLTPLHRVAALLAGPDPARHAVLAASAEGTLALAELTVTGGAR